MVDKKVSDRTNVLATFQAALTKANEGVDDEGID